jgi:hypothetical protein
MELQDQHQEDISLVEVEVEFMMLQQHPLEDLVEVDLGVATPPRPVQELQALLTLEEVVGRKVMLTQVQQVVVVPE